MQRFLPALRPRTWLILAGLLVLVGLLLPLDVIHGQGLLDGEGPIREFLFVVILNLTGWFLWLGGSILDYGVNAFVINFGTNFNENGVGVAVNQLWVIVRDFFNILFIFGLVYIGFKMILNSDDSQTKKTLVYLIMAALLINFSLFITKFVVDFTNVLAGEVAVAGFAAATGGGTTIGGDARNEVAIGDTFFGLMGIQQNVLLTPAGVAENEVQPWSYIFGIGIINIIGAFAFGVGGIMLIIRFVALSVYMVLSPFMFLGWIFPGFQSMSSKYWSGFLKQAFYAPVYIVMIFFAATILNNFFATGTGSFQNANMGALANTEGSILGAEGGTGALGGSAGDAVQFGGGLAPFILSAAFLIAAVQVAGKLSADGSSVMAKVGGAVQSRVRRTVQGGAMFVPRRAAQYATAGGGAAVTGGVNLARRTRLGRLATNNQLGVAAMKAGQASKNVKLGGSSSMRERQVGTQARVSQYERDEKIAQARKIKADTIDPVEIQLLADAQTAANEYSQKDIEAMSSGQRNELVKLLKAGTITKLLDSDNLSSGEKGQIAGEYKKVIEKKITEDGKLITEELHKLSIKQLEILGDDFIRDHAAMFTDSQMDDLKKSESFSEQQKGQQIGVRKQQMGLLAKEGSITIPGRGTDRKAVTVTRDYLYKSSKRNDAGKHEMGKTLKPTELATRSYDAFVDEATGTIRPDARGLVSADVLKQIARNAQLGKSSMSDDEREKLAYAVLSTPGIPGRVASYLKKDKGVEDFFLEEKDIKTAEKRRDGTEISEAVGDGTLGM